MKLIGFGLDYQHFSEYEVHGRELIETFANRLSHASIVGLTNFRETADFKAVTGGLPVVHHLSGIEPAGLNGVNWKQFAFQNKVSTHLNAAWCGEDIGIWSIGPYAIPYFAPPVFCREVLDHTIANVQLLKAKSAVPFFAEVPSCSFYAGDISPGEFFTELSQRAECALVLDISHVFSFAAYFGQKPLDVLNSFPLESVGELHVAGGSLSPKFPYRYRDTHSEPIMNEVLEIYQAALLKCRSLRAITYEVGVGLSLEILTEDFSKVEKLASQSGFTPRLVNEEH